MRAFFADTETASLEGGVCDLAFIEIDENLDVIRTFEALLDPVVEIAPAAEAVHGISRSMIENEPTMKELVARDGYPFPMDEDFYLIGHNVRFDRRVLDAEEVLPPGAKNVCTLRMARNLWPDINPKRENHQLGTLAVMFGLERGPAHRAMGDCVTGLNLLRHIAKLGLVNSFDELMQLGQQPLSLEIKMPFGKHKDEKLKDLPISYVRWFCGQEDIDPDLKEALKARLK